MIIHEGDFHLYRFFGYLMMAFQI